MIKGAKRYLDQAKQRMKAGPKDEKKQMKAGPKDEYAHTMAGFDDEKAEDGQQTTPDNFLAKLYQEFKN